MTLWYHSPRRRRSVSFHAHFSALILTIFCLPPNVSNDSTVPRIPTKPTVATIQTIATIAQFPRPQRLPRKARSALSCKPLPAVKSWKRWKRGHSPPPLPFQHRQQNNRAPDRKGFPSACRIYVSRYSLSGLTALSIIFPIQLLMTALGTGTGTGLNLLISRMDGNGDTARQGDVVKSGLYLGAFNFFAFTLIGMLLIGSYYAISSDQANVRAAGIQYAQIIFLGSFGLFMESNCTKLLQAKGNMVTPMLAQVAGAVIKRCCGRSSFWSRLRGCSTSPD